MQIKAKRIELIRLDAACSRCSGLMERKGDQVWIRTLTGDVQAYAYFCEKCEQVHYLEGVYPKLVSSEEVLKKDLVDIFNPVEVVPL